MDFSEYAAQPDAQLSLLEGALFIAKDAYPDLDCAEQRMQLDELALPLQKAELEGIRAPAQAVALAAYMSSDCGFRGNSEDYYAPENSFINRVLERRLGIPISLAVVYIELAARAGVSAAGVGFPGHFLVRIQDADDHIIVDPFSNRILERGELERLCRVATHGRRELNDEMLEPAPTRNVIARMLLNLRSVYASRADRRRLLVVLDRLVDLLPLAVEHRRDRGLLCAELGAPRAALADIEAYLTALPHAADSEDLGRLRKSLGASLAASN
jgi:regulator of sirC expression with transglutaminase-like and TPR domain